MDLIDDLTKFVKSPDAHAVRYLAVGGAAVDVLGFLRMTEDLDFADCWPRHTDEALEGRDVPRLALEELVINKCADRHPPRLADIDEFERRTW